MMKKYINIFLITSFFGVTVVPSYNIYSDLRGRQHIIQQKTSWFTLKNAFNFDFILPKLSFVYYKRGISASPDSVIIGKKGWLFLGDRYANVMTESRGLTPFIKDRIDEFAEARHSWDTLVRKNGGTGYFVSIAPNSHSIYREMMPDWAKKSKKSKNIEYLINQSESDSTLIDLGKKVIANKFTSDVPLYYKTDTHWNEVGGWYGYQELMSAITQTDLSLKSLKRQDIHFEFKSRTGGDLSHFLWISPLITDTEVVTEINLNTKLHITDWRGATIRDGDLSDRQKNMVPELIVTSSNALNTRKVLWLRDSFGAALYPYMNATFSTIMQKHYQDILSNPERLQEIIANFKPDLVIITTVERSSLSAHFGTFPTSKN